MNEKKTTVKGFFCGFAVVKLDYSFGMNRKFGSFFRKTNNRNTDLGQKFAESGTKHSVGHQR